MQDQKNNETVEQETVAAEAKSTEKSTKSNADKKKIKALETALEEANAKADELNEKYMRMLAEAYDNEDKQEFYEFRLALEALKQSLNGDQKTVILDGNSELAKILMGSK